MKRSEGSKGGNEEDEEFGGRRGDIQGWEW